jgi:hypothetical protein
MTRERAAAAFLVLFVVIGFGLVAFTDIGWIVAFLIAAVAGGLAAGAIAERSRG